MKLVAISHHLFLWIGRCPSSGPLPSGNRSANTAAPWRLIPWRKSTKSQIWRSRTNELIMADEVVLSKQNAALKKTRRGEIRNKNNKWWNFLLVTALLNLEFKTYGKGKLANSTLCWCYSSTHFWSSNMNWSQKAANYNHPAQPQVSKKSSLPSLQSPNCWSFFLPWVVYPVQLLRSMKLQKAAPLQLQHPEVLQVPHPRPRQRLKVLEIACWRRMMWQL